MSDLQGELLGELTELVESDNLIGRASEYLDRVDQLVAQVHASGETRQAPDPFRGTGAETPADPHAYYTMFWRMFDQTPAAMIQDFAIQVRQILAARIFQRCGEDVIFHHNVLFSRGSNIELGDGVLVNRYVMLDDRAPLRVGSYTMLAAGVTIETHIHPFDDFSKPIAYSGRQGLPVTIGDNCVIGYNAVVMAGVTIGTRCIVGANSVVTRDVPDYTVVGGVPAKTIKQYLPPQ